LQSYATPLEIAVRHGDIALVKWLLKQGAPVNDSDPIEGLTILDAALSSDYNMFKLLIDHGARVNAKTAYGYLMDFARHNMLQEIRELLIEQGAHFDLFPLDHAKNTDTCQNTVTCLLENGASLHTKDKENHTLLHAAVRKKPRCGCEHNLDDDLWENNYTKNNACVPVDHTVQRNRAWLHAICKGDLKKVEEGIAAGISVNQLTQKGTVPLHIEVYMGYIKNPYAKLRITYGYTPLHLAAYQGNTALVKLLLQKGANSNAKDTQHGYTPLHLAACQGHAQAVERLLAHNALINVKEKRLERTPLHLAAATGNSATVRHLINHGALHSIDKHNWTPLHVAIASRNATAVIKLLIDKGDVLDKTELDKTEDTLLHFATKEKAIAAMRYLIQKGANVNATNAAGNTALHFAAKSHMLEGCKLLIAAGAEVDHANKKGKTPLYMACGDNYNGVLVEFLIQKGINVNHKNKNGKTALQLAIQNNLHSDIITLLGSKADRGRQPLEVQPFTFFNTSFFKALVKKNTEKEDKKTKKSNIAPTVTQ
jgi:ankyrin repeat protein